MANAAGRAVMENGESRLCLETCSCPQRTGERWRSGKRQGDFCIRYLGPERIEMNHDDPSPDLPRR